MALFYVLWPCPTCPEPLSYVLCLYVLLSYGPVLCPEPLSYVPWPCPTSRGPVLCPWPFPMSQIRMKWVEVRPNGKPTPANRMASRGGPFGAVLGPEDWAFAKSYANVSPPPKPPGWPYLCYTLTDLEVRSVLEPRRTRALCGKLQAVGMGMRVVYHACLRACVHACVRACVRASMHACMHMRHACMHACMHMRHACMHALL